jgi:hypothetical protein
MRCTFCKVRDASPDGCACTHPMCAAAAIWTGLAERAGKARVRARAAMKAHRAMSLAQAVALVERTGRC